MVAEPSPSWDACKTALKDCCNDPAFRANRALESHRDDISPSVNFGLHTLARVVGCRQIMTYRISSIAARRIPNKYCLSLT